MSKVRRKTTKKKDFASKGTVEELPKIIGSMDEYKKLTVAEEAKKIEAKKAVEENAEDDDDDEAGDDDDLWGAIMGAKN